MIELIKKGRYEVVETKKHTKVLFLDGDPYAWISPMNIGEILVTSHHKNESDTHVSAGRYALYDVKDEELLTDLEHLELEYGNDAWQGYLLPTGLPTHEKIRARIIPTDQLITNTSLTLTMKHLMLNHPKLLIRTTEKIS